MLATRKVVLVLGLVAQAALARAEAGPESRSLAEPAGGWRSARWGMSPEEVLGAFPGEAAAIEPALLLADGSAVAVAIPSHTVAAQVFRVHFVFQRGGLALVSLRSPPDQTAPADAFEKLEKHFETQLGPPAERSRDAGLVDMRQTRWDVGRTRVDLKYIPGVIVILHSPRTAGGGSATPKPSEAKK